MKIPSYLVSTKMALKILGCSLSTLANLRRRGLISSVYIYGKGRGKPVFFFRRELESFFENTAQSDASSAAGSFLIDGGVAAARQAAE